MDKRLTELETKLTYQDQTIESLNERVIEQQQQIDQLLLTQAKLTTRLKSLDSGEGLMDPSSEAPPPHY